MPRITIDFNHSRGMINRNIYGHFSEHIGGVFYDGLWVGEESKVENIRGFRKALVDSFKKLEPPVLRWPGGCFAETYDWRDGIGPRAQRPRRVNWWYSRDHRVESNQVGTHEFIDFCRLVGAEPYFAANMTSVTPLHIRDWMEYCNFPAGLTTLSDERAQNGSVEPFNVRFWGIGNENWGGGGQMSPEMCAQEYIRYTTICDPLGSDNYKFIMCGANGADTEWTRRVMQEYTSRKGGMVVPTYGMSVHYYCGGTDLEFDEEGWYDNIFRADRMKDVIDGHRAAMDEFDPERKIKLIVDEWGNWHREGSGPSNGYNLFEQQSNMRDAVVAALTLNIFNNRCDVVDMANIAQLCNNLHSLYLASGENFVETVNYHVFDMFKGHKDARQLNAIVDAPLLHRDGFADIESVSASASVKDGVLTLTLANLDLTSSQHVEIGALGGSLAGNASVRILACNDPNRCNTFDEPNTIIPVNTTVEAECGMGFELPAAGVAVVEIPVA